MDYVDAFKLAKERLGLQDLHIACKQVEQKGYLSVKRNGDNFVIDYNNLCSLFRGLSLIKENISKKDFEISTTKHFDTNGYMLDCSRNGVMKISELKSLIMTMALMGQNRLLLYTEDTYKLEKYPYFGYLRGSYSLKDIKELVAYGKCFGVELIPCIQTLGHLERPLRWDTMRELQDGTSTLMIGEESTYEFIEEMIKFSKEAFGSKEIHIGMDEAFELGLGRYLGKHPYTDRVTLFTQHIARVIQICKKYDFEPMIWSDMYFRLNDPEYEYYRSTPLPESTLKMIPNDVGLVYWDYYHKSEIYERMFKFHKQTPNKLYFAGGAWRWKGFAPDIRNSLDMSIDAIKACLSNQIKNVFVTAWGDNGNECSVYPTLPIIALYSQADYFGEYSIESINSLLQAVVDETVERMKLLDLPNMPDGKVLCAAYNPCKFLFYQDPLNGLFDLQVKDSFVGNYKDYAIQLNKAAKESKNFGYVYKTLADLCDVLTLKTDLGIKLRKAYKNGDKESLKQLANVTIPEIQKRLAVFHESFRYQWMKENKHFGYDVIDGRMGWLNNRLTTSTVLVNDYLNGKIDQIDELETEILPYNGHDYEVCWNSWLLNVSVHSI